MLFSSVHGLHYRRALVVGDDGSIVAGKGERLKAAFLRHAVERRGGRLEFHGFGLRGCLFRVVFFGVGNYGHGFGRWLVGGARTLEDGESSDDDHDRRAAMTSALLGREDAISAV